MSKPWEEKWTAELNRDRTHYDLVVDQDGLGVCVVQGCGSSDDGTARVLLAAAAPDMARVLLAIEWAGAVGERFDGFDPACPSCLTEKFTGKHAPDCALDAALRKAGVR